MISEGRTKKERAINTLKEKRFKDAVEKLIKSVEKGNVVLPEKVGRRIGRILQKYPSMAAFYEIILTEDEKGKKIIKVFLSRKKQADQKENLHGCYVIETSRKELDSMEIWKLYTALHYVEQAFARLKSDLGFRPIHHQLPERTEAHLFVSVLAYHHLALIENLLKKGGDDRKWATICSIMSTLSRSTVGFTDEKGSAHHIRMTGAIEPEQKRILDILNISPFVQRYWRKFDLRL